MKRVIGIGGVFFRAKDPEKLRAWYQKHLGLEFDAYGKWFLVVQTTMKNERLRRQFGRCFRATRSISIPAAPLS